MSTVDFNKQAQDLWANKAKQTGKDKTPPNPLEQALADNQLTRKEYDTLLKAFKSQNPDAIPDTFNAWLADVLDGKTDGQSKQALKDAVKHLSDGAGTGVSIAFNLNPAQNGYFSIAAVTLEKPDKDLLAQLKSVDQDRNGRIESHERPKLQTVLTELAQKGKASTEYSFLQAQAQDSFSTITYDEKHKTVTVFLTDAAPVMDNSRKDLRFTGTLYLEDIDGINDRSRDDLKGRVNGQFTMDYGLLSRVFRQVLNPVLPNGSSAYDSKYLSVNGGYSLTVGKEYFDDKRNAYVIKGTASATAGAYGFNVNPSIDLEVLLSYNHQGELTVSIPGLDESLIPGTGKLRNFILTQIETALREEVTQKDFGIKFATRQETLTETTTGFTSLFTGKPVTKEVGRQLNLRPHMQLKLPNPFPTPAGEKAGTLDINLPTTSRDIRLKVDRKGVHVDFRDTPITGSTDSSRAPATPDRVSDRAELELSYGMNTDFKSGELDHKVVVKDAKVKVDIQEGELQDFAFMAQKHGVDPGKSGQLEMHLRGQAGNQNSVQGSVSLKTDSVDAFSHIQIQQGNSGQTRTRISLSGADLSYLHKKAEIKTKAKTGSVTVGGDQPVQIEMFGVDGKVKLNLSLLKAIQSQIKSGNQALIKLLEKSLLKPEFMQQLSAGSVKDLESLLKLNDFVKQFQQMAVALKAEHLNMTVSDKQVVADATKVKTETHISGGTAEKTAHITLSSQAQTVAVDHQTDKKTTVTTTTAQVKGALSSKQKDIKLAASSASSTQRTDVILDGDGAVATIGVKGLNSKNAFSLEHASGLQTQATVDSTKTHGTLNIKKGQHVLQAQSLTSSGQVTLGASTMAYTTAWQDVKWQRQANGKFSLQAPTGEVATVIQASVEQLKTLAGRIGYEKLKTLLQTDKEDVLRQSLQKVGLSAKDVDKAMGLLLHPRVREISRTSDFVTALQKSDRLEVRVSGQSALAVNGEATQTSVHLKQTQGVVSAGLGNGQQTLLHTTTQVVDGELKAGATTHVSARQLTNDTQGHRPSGDKIGSVKTTLSDVQLNTQANGHHVQAQQTVIEGDFNTTLDAVKIEELEKILTDVKVRIQERLKSFGLSKKQIELFVKAFGEEQLKNLFQSANKKDLQAMLKEIGASDSQLKRIMKLLDEKQLQQVVEDIWQFSSVLKDSQAKLGVKASMGPSHWTQSDKTTDMASQKMQANVFITTQGEQGQAEISAVGHLKQAQIRGQDGQWQTEWQDGHVTVDSHASKPGQNPTHDLKLTGQASLDRITTQHDQTHRKTTVGKITAQANADYKLPERSANASVQGGVQGVKAITDYQNPRQSTQTTTGLGLQGKANVNQKGTETQANAALNIEKLHTTPQEVHLTNTDLTGHLNARQTEDGETAQGNLRGQITLGQYDQTEQGVQGQKLHVDANALLGVKKGDAAVTMHGNIKGGAGEFNAAQGKVTVPEIHGQAAGTILSPLVNLDVTGKLNLTDVQSQDGHVKAATSSIHDVQGSLNLKTDKLRELFDKHPDAFKLLHQMSKHLEIPNAKDKKGVAFIKSNDIAIEFKDMALTGEKGNALAGQQTITGRIKVPAVETHFGKAEATIQLEKVALSEARGNDIRVGGSVRFTPNKKEFEQQIKRLLDKQLALSDLPRLDTQVELANGQIRLKVDRWFLDGAVGIACEGDKLVVTVDRAKLLHLISAKGMVSGKVADQLSQRLIGFNQHEEKLSISLTDLTRSLTHQDNLQLTSVQLKKDNTFDINFAYTDGRDFQAQQRQRGQQHLEKTLFRDPLNGNQVREEGDLEDLVEDLPADTLQEVFQTGNIKQLRKVLTAVGKDYDDIIRKTLGEGKDLSRYPVETKALMAAYLASDSGIFESVDSEEKALIRKLYQSLKANEYQRFMAPLTAEEQKRVKAYLPKRS